MELQKALDTIGYILGVDIEEQLVRGLDEDYDPELIIDIAEACKKWEQREDERTITWNVHFYDCPGESLGDGEWSIVAIGLSKNDAYRIWYEKTNGGKDQADSRSKSYYHFGRSDEELRGRHSWEKEEDDFSVSYLLAKSFGE